MRIIDNARAAGSTFFGLAGGLSMAGWAAKAVTPVSASPTAKIATCIVTSTVVTAVTFGTLVMTVPATVSIAGVELSFYTGTAVDVLGAAWAGVCTALSYTVGGGLGTRGGGHVAKRTPAADPNLAKAKTPGFLTR